MFGLFGKKQKINATIEVVDPRDVPAHCFIAGNLHIRGDVMFSGSLRIDGRVDGKVCTFDGTKGHLIVSKGAVINGPVQVTSVLADGTMSGDMRVEEKLECRSNAVIRGLVKYGSIHIADGARIEARCEQKDLKPTLVAVDSVPEAWLATRKIVPIKRNTAS